MKEKIKALKMKLAAVYLAMKKPETPLPAKIMAGLTIAYALSPVDLIPDFIPVLGYLDDLIILPAMIMLTLKLIPKDIISQCVAESENLWASGRPKKWYFALPVILIWLLLVYLVVKHFFF